MELFAIPNLQSQSVFRVVPWEFKPDIPESVLRSKKDFTDWRVDPTTKHCLYSAYEGEAASIRVTEANPPHKLYGFIADYDNHNITQDQIESNVRRPPAEWLPAYSHRTYSGGARLLWLFERPIRVPKDPLLLAFLKYTIKKIRLPVFLPGFDEGAFLKVGQYYDVGTDWTPLNPDYRITYSSLSHWLYDAGNRIDWSDKLCHIPITEVAIEVERQFPGRWPGAFEIDAMGPRFWDPAADNPRGCIVRESGMQCFTGDEWFLPWTAILGRQFVDRYQEQQVAVVSADTYFDGKDFWYTDLDGIWQPWSKDDLKLRLRVHHKLRSTGRTAKAADPGSEIDKVLAHIHTHNRVEAALPFVHMPPGLMKIQGLKFLNTSMARCMSPSEYEPREWGDHFPWVAGFLNDFFDPHIQLDYFISWLHYFYKHALLQKPQAGQAIFLVGPTGAGKTMLSNRILSHMMGGHADASSFLLGDDRFTASVLRFPIMAVDDTVPATDVVRHNRYSAMVKKIVANRWLSFEQKYQKAGKVLWNGRIMVTCNADPESIRLLPNMDISIRDKVSLFGCCRREKPFPTVTELDAILDEELPYFCRWLLNYVVPEHCRGDARFFVKPYHHAKLHQKALQSSASFSFFELLQTFLREYGKARNLDHWEGSGTDLLAAMLADEGLRPLAAKMDSNRVAMYLGQLKSRGYNLVKVRDRERRWWRIPTNIESPTIEAAGKDSGEGVDDDDKM